MTTLADLDAKADRQVKALNAPKREARRLIEGKIADAHAHAVKALTAKAKDTPDGRATIATVRRSPSFQAALSRLDELKTGLVELVAEWRVRSYRAAFIEWTETVPEEWLRPNPMPTDKNLSWARGFALHGMPLISEVGDATKMAGRRLGAVIAQAATRTLQDRASLDLIRAWETRTVGSLIAVADRLLSDSQIMVDRKAGRDVCRPELLEDDPTLPR